MPNALALEILAGTAEAEVCAHLAAGQCVHGMPNGRHLVLHSDGCGCLPCGFCNGTGYSPAPELCTVCRGLGALPGDELWADAPD